MKSVVMGRPKDGEVGKVGREPKLKEYRDGRTSNSSKEDKVRNVVMGGVKTGKLEIWKVAKLTKRCGANVRRNCGSRS